MFLIILKILTYEPEAESCPCPPSEDSMEIKGIHCHLIFGMEEILYVLPTKCTQKIPTA